MPIIKSFLLALAQFVVGFLFYLIIVTIFNFLVFAVINRLFDYFSNTAQIVSMLILIVIQLIGIGFAIRNFRSKMRWFGVGNFCAILLFILGAILVSGCMQPLLFPFPLSLMSAC